MTETHDTGSIRAQLLAVADASEQWAGYGVKQLTMSHGELATLLREAAAALAPPPAMRLLRHPWDDRPIAEVPVESYEVLTALLRALWSACGVCCERRLSDTSE